MNYLARLKQLEFFHNTPGPVPSKPTKGASDGFDGSLPGAHENISAENDVVETGTESDLILKKWHIPIPAKPSKGNARIAEVMAMLQADPGLRYAMKTHENVEPGTVILALAIKDKGACEIRIPAARYDGVILLQLIEKHSKGLP